jgi:hypothetical protein
MANHIALANKLSTPDALDHRIRITSFTTLGIRLPIATVLGGHRYLPQASP